jgi:hypothetical protein
MVGDLLGPADRAKINRIMSANLVFPVVRQHLAVLFEIVPAGKIEMIELQINAELHCGGLEHANALGHDLLANAVTRDDCNSFFTGVVHGAHGVIL